MKAAFSYIPGSSYIINYVSLPPKVDASKIPLLLQLYHSDRAGDDFYAEFHNDATTIEILRARDTEGFTLFENACFNGNKNLVRQLLKKGINPFEDDVTKDGKPQLRFLQCLAECNNKEKAQVILNLILSANFREEINKDSNLQIYKEIIDKALQSNNVEIAIQLVNLSSSKDKIFSELIKSFDITDQVELQTTTISTEDGSIKEKKIINRKDEISKTESDILLLEQQIQDIDNYEKKLNAAKHDTESKKLFLEELIKQFSTNNSIELITRKNQAEIEYLRSIDYQNELEKQNSPTLKTTLEENLSKEKKYRNELLRGTLKPLRVLYRSIVDEISKKNALRTAVLEGEHFKVGLLLRKDVLNKPYYNVNIEGEGTILNSAFNRIKSLEKDLLSLDKSSTDYQKKSEEKITLIKNIYRSIKFITEQNDLNVEKVVLAKPPGNQQNFLLQAYIDFKENLIDPDPEIRFHKQELFNRVFSKFKESANFNDHCIELLKATAKYKDPAIFNEIIEKIVNIPPEHQIEILINAAQSGSREIFNKVLETSTNYDGLKTSFQNKLNLLMAACKGGNYNIIDTVLTDKNKFGVEINQRDAFGNRALHHLVNSSGLDNIAIINRLVSEGADIEATNNFGHTPLIQAVCVGNVALVKELISKGANVNAIDKEGNTPLIYAVDSNNPEIIKAILDSSNLDVSHKNYKGVSAYSIAISRDIATEAIEKVTEADKVIAETTNDLTKNHYKDLSLVLLQRGADPYKVAPTTLKDLVLTTALASGAVKASNILADSLNGTMFSGVGGVLRAITSLGAGLAVQSASYTFLSETLDNYLTPESAKVSLKDEVMIGSIHKGTWVYKKGSSLKEDMEKPNSNFKEADQGIYTIIDLNTKIEKIVADSNTNRNIAENKKWLTITQKSLQDKYITSKKMMEDRSTFTKIYDKIFYFPERALRQNLESIKEASELLLNTRNRGIPQIGTVETSGNNNNSRKNFEQINEVLINIIKSPKDSPKLIKRIITNPIESKELETVITQVVSKEILVSPDTYYHFCLFDETRRKICKDEITKSEFIKSTDTKDFKIPELDISNNNKLAELIKDVDTSYINPPGKSSIVEQAIETTQKVARKYSSLVKTYIFKPISAITGTYVAIKDQPEAAAYYNNITGIVKNIATTTVAVGAAAYNFVPAGVGYALGGTAIVAGTVAGIAYLEPWKYFTKEEIKEEPKLSSLTISKSDLPDLLTEKQVSKNKYIKERIVNFLKSSKKSEMNEEEAKKILERYILKKKEAKARISREQSDASSQKTISVSSINSSSVNGDITTSVKEDAKKAVSPIMGLMEHETDRDTFSEKDSLSGRTSSITLDNSERSSSSSKISEDIKIQALDSVRPLRSISKEPQKQSFISRLIRWRSKSRQ